ncbi:MAG TPA: hypothetical protein VIE68_10180 [Gemmatimonadota bacterium]|jgi:hypothetical protein
MTRRAILAGLVLATACSGSGTESEGPLGTLAGQITVGPFCPVEIEGKPCPTPPGTYESIQVLVTTRDSGRLVAEANPDSTGRFRLDLPSGSYRVALEHSLGIPGGPEPAQDARVDAGRTTTLLFDIDTGIR